jgi:hypothetical protein
MKTSLIGDLVVDLDDNTVWKVDAVFIDNGQASFILSSKRSGESYYVAGVTDFRPFDNEVDGPTPLNN